MKILNIFKKKQKSEFKSTNLQKIEKNQLEKVIGGADGASHKSGKGVIVGDGGVGY